MAVEGAICITEDVMHRISEEQFAVLSQIRDGANIEGPEVAGLERLGYVKNGAITEKGLLVFSMKDKKSIINTARCGAR